MLSGKAPIGTDGRSVQLHHVEGIVNNFKKFTMDLENAATGPQIHIQTGKGARHKYIFDGVSDFVNSSGESIASAIKNSRIVQDGLTKARYLIEKGWPWR